MTETAAALNVLFDGKKAKWLPLYRRMLARFNSINGIDFFPKKGFIAIGHLDDERATLGLIKITSKGLEIGLGLAKAFGTTERLRVSQRSPKWITHRVTVASASEMDDEFLSWFKAARLRARTLRARS